MASTQSFSQVNVCKSQQLKRYSIWLSNHLEAFRMTYKRAYRSEFNTKISNFNAKLSYSTVSLLSTSLPSPNAF